LAFKTLLSKGVIVEASQLDFVFPDELIQYIPRNPSHLAIVGEAPGTTEMTEGLPFVGEEGKYLTVLLRRAGINRYEHFITNTVHVQPPGNVYDALLPIDLLKGTNQLQKDLELWKSQGLKTVVALGAKALKALTGKDKITFYRGTELPCTLVPGLKVCPTFHPGYLKKGNGEMEPVVVADLIKLQERAHISEVFYPERNIHIISDARQAMDILTKLSKTSDPLTVDIENNKGRMTAYGMGISPKEAFVITQDLLTMPMVLRSISEFAISPAPKIFHNALYDCFHGLHYYRFYYHNIFLDTMIAQHAAYPNLPKSLAFCSSLYCQEPYWKDEGKNTMMLLYREGLRGDELWKRHYIYNGKDCCLTHEIFPTILKEVKDFGAGKSLEMDMALIYPCLYAMEKGLSVDLAAMNGFAENNERALEILERIKEATIGPVNVNSSPQLQHLIYDQWGFKVHKKQRRPTTDQDAMNEMESLPTPYEERLGLISKLKEHYTTRKFYRISLDTDGKVRYALNIAGTYTGRMSSSESIIGTGTNYQNQPEEVRIFYVSDPGKIFINLDASQSEARIVAALCGDIEWLRAFDTRDLHAETAALMFDVPLEKVDKKKHRDPAKRVGHGTHYKMGPKKLSAVIKRPRRETERLRDIYYAIHPTLRLWQNKVARDLRTPTSDKYRIIRTCYGRVIQFMGPLDDEAERMAIAAEPQSTSVSYINTGLIRCWEELPEFDFRLQLHDSLLWEVPDNLHSIITSIQEVRSLVEKPMTVNGITFTIPLEFEIGYCWGKLVKVKDLKNIGEIYQKLQREHDAVQPVPGELSHLHGQ
jgi:DNA polymerase